MPSDVPDLPIRIAVLAVCLCFSAFFSASETALFSFQPDELQRKAGMRGADGMIAALRSRPKRLLITILFGNMVANVVFYSASFLLLLDMAPGLGSGGVLVLSVASLLTVLLLGEVVPKNVAVTFYHALGPLVALPVALIQKVLWPVVWPLEKVADAAAALLGGGGHAVRAEELRMLVGLGAQEGAVDPGLGQMLADVIGLSEVGVSELMVPRVEMTTFDLHQPEEELLALFRSSKLAVVAVYEDNPEDVRGVVHLKDVLFRPEGTGLRELVQQIPYLPETATVEQGLRQCRRGRRTSAFVVDEYGTVVGLVTMEALLEQIVGEIANEYDAERPPSIEPLGDGRFRVQGGASLRDWEEATGVKAPELGVDTVGGLVMALLDKMPEEGDTVRCGPLEFTVETVEGRRAASMIARPAPEAAAPERTDA